MTDFYKYFFKKKRISSYIWTMNQYFFPRENAYGNTMEVLAQQRLRLLVVTSDLAYCLRFYIWKKTGASSFASLSIVSFLIFVWCTQM